MSTFQILQKKRLSQETVETDPSSQHSEKKNEKNKIKLTEIRLARLYIYIYFKEKKTTGNILKTLR